ncbi:MAG: hypothetical protein V1495_07440 [Pseudomonadota bacterium]
MGYRKAILILPLTLLLATCGQDRNIYNGYATGTAMNRVSYIMGPIPSAQVQKTNLNRRDALLQSVDDPYLAIDLDHEGKTFRGTQLTLTPFGKKFRFQLQLPDPDVPHLFVRYEGEIHPPQNGDGDTLSGFVQIPYACNGGLVEIFAPQADEKIGSFLPVRFDDVCRFGWNARFGTYGRDIAFQKKSEIAARQKPATP